MNTIAPVSPDHPLMKAWIAYQQSDEFKNTFKLATSAILIGTQDSAIEARAIEMREEMARGALWAAFMVGFNSGFDSQQQFKNLIGWMGRQEKILQQGVKP